MYGLWDITFSLPDGASHDGGDSSGSDISVDGGGLETRRLSTEVVKVYDFSYPCRETTVEW